jgi:DNA-directed RNA polymerase
MDTNVLPNEPQDLHVELERAFEKSGNLYDRAMTNVGFGATTGGLAITNQYHLLVTEAVSETLKVSRAQSHGHDFQIERLLKQLKPEVVALCILQAGLHAVARERTQVETAISIGHSINDELWAADLVKADKKLAERIARTVKETYGDVAQRKTHAKKLAAKLGAFTLDDWTEEMLVHAGTWAMNVLLQAMPDVFMLTEPEKVCNPLTGQFEECRQWVITDEGMDKARSAVAEAVLKSPVYQPRTERPQDWTRFVMNVAEDDRTTDAGPAAADVPQGHHQRHGTPSALAQAAPALKAINTLQSVPFKINTWIMDVIQQCYDKGIRVDGLPYRNQFKVPARVLCGVQRQAVEARRLHAKTIKGLKKANRANVVDIVAFEQDMDVAARLRRSSSSSTRPMNMDWRGSLRAHPLQLPA